MTTPITTTDAELVRAIRSAQRDYPAGGVAKAVIDRLTRPDVIDASARKARAHEIARKRLEQYHLEEAG